MDDKVRCADCGFLAIRFRETRQLVEVEEKIRRTGEIPTRHEREDGTLRENPWYAGVPICFERVVDFSLEYQQRASSTARKDIVLDLIETPRECPKFFSWKQGFTPKEHKEMQFQDQMQKWQAEQREAERKWQNAQREADRHFQQAVLSSQEKSQSEQKRHDRFFEALLVIFAAFLAWFLSHLSNQPPPIVNVNVPEAKTEK